MTKVLFITSTFPRSKDDVLAKWIGELAQRLTRGGMNVSIFAPSSRGLSSHIYKNIKVVRFRYAPESIEVLTQDEGAVFKIRNNPFLLLLIPFFFIFGFIQLIFHLIKNHYDVIHVHWPFPMGLFGLLAKFLNGGKLVLTFYGAEFTLIRKVPFGNLILKFIIRFADKVTAISSYTAGLVKKVSNVPVSVIPFTSGFTFNQSFRELISKSKKTKIILFTGRLIERKGVKYLISAMPRVLKEVDAKLEIVGDGPLLDNLKDQVRKLGLEKNINLNGRVSDKGLIDLYKKCDLFVLPSIKDRSGDTEGLGVVLLEAMGFAKPVIASEIGGITDIVKHGYTGLLVSQKNTKELAEAIIEVLKNKKLSDTLAQNGFNYLKDNFDWNTITEKTRVLYTDAS